MSFRAGLWRAFAASPVCWWFHLIHHMQTGDDCRFMNNSLKGKRRIQSKSRWSSQNARSKSCWRTWVGTVFFLIALDFQLLTSLLQSIICACSECLSHKPQVLAFNPWIQDPNRYQGDGAYKAAFLDGIAEHNAFGVAASNSKYQIDQSTSLELLGLRVPRLIHWVMLSWVESVEVYNSLLGGSAFETCCYFSTCLLLLLAR